MSRTYDELFERDLPCLGVYYDPKNTVLRWAITNVAGDGELYSRASTFDHAWAFIRAAVRQGDATADETSIEYYRALRQFGHWSVRVPALDAGEVVAPSWDVADGTSPASNVVQFRKPAA